MKYLVVGDLSNDRSEDSESFDVVAEVEAADTEGAEIAAFNLALAKRGHQAITAIDDFKDAGWNAWILAVIELSPGLPVAVSGSETYMPALEASDPDQRADLPLFVLAGSTMDGETWVQRLRAKDINAAQRMLKRGPLDDPRGIHAGAVEHLDGRIETVNQTPATVLRGKAPPRGPAVSQDDLQTINAHRRGLGIGPIDLGAGWTGAEIAEMAARIRRTGTMSNPQQDSLRRRLMR